MLQSLNIPDFKGFLRRCGTVFLAWLLLQPHAVAQTAQLDPLSADPLRRGLSLDQFPRMIPLAPNVYAYEDLRPPGFTTVSLIVVGNDGVLIADGQWQPAQMRRMLQEIARITPKPVRWYVVGSDHEDHTGGNSVLPDGVRYIVSPASRAQLQRDAIAAKDKPGALPVVVPPQSMSGASETVDVGGMSVQVLMLGRAHTGGDLSVYLPRQRILFMSEAFFNRVFPAMRSAYPEEWLGVIDRALAMPVDVYVPGHGFVESAQRSREELLVFRAALAHVIGEVRRLHGLGLSRKDALAQAQWGMVGQWMLADSQREIAINRIYDMLDGKIK